MLTNAVKQTDSLRNVAVHGIGDALPDYWQGWRIPETLRVLAESVSGFWYEDIMERDGLNVLTRLTAKAMAFYYAPRLGQLGLEKPIDYLSDIFVFFLSEGARKAIEQRLVELLARERGEVRFLCHSLGSIILYWFCMRNPALASRIHLVTMGSPLGSQALAWLVKRRLRGLLKRPLVRPNVLSWVNVHSEMDPLSGAIAGMGCDQQYGIPWAELVRHRQVDRYLTAYAKR